MNSKLIKSPQDSDFSELSELSEDPSNTGAIKGKDHCANCETLLSGKYCHACGQPSRSIIKFFGQVLVDVADDIVGYDSRLKHTVFPLLFKPGRITMDYIQGKVFYYVLPFRLYLILSVVCLLMVQAITDPKQMVTDETVVINGQKDPKAVEQELQKAQLQLDEAGIDINLLDNFEKQQANRLENNQQKIQAQEQTDSLNLDETDSAEKKLKVNQNEISNSQSLKLTSDYFEFDIDPKSDQITFSGEFFKEYPSAKNAITDIYQKSKGWKQDPTPLVNQIFEIFPIMMLVILPLFAMVLKIFYVFKKRYYIEHLVFCLHNHCFIYFALILEILLSLLQTRLSQYQHTVAQFIAELASYASVALTIWIVFYIAIAMKRVYRQGWFMTLSKTMILGFIYMTFLVVGLFATALVGAWQA